MALDLDKADRADALTRLARLRRNMHDHDAAIRAYDQLLELTDAAVSGLPADLVAHEGRASLFEEMHRTSDLRREASAFDEVLRSGRWQLTKSQFEFYCAEATGWLGSSPKWADADAVT